METGIKAKPQKLGFVSLLKKLANVELYQRVIWVQTILTGF